MNIGKVDRAGWLFLGAAWLALLAGCVVHSRHAPMWVDELYSYNLIQDPSLSHMLAAEADQAEGIPPLYYFFIRPWSAVFSMSELSLRLFSSMAFCAAFALIWKTLRRAFEFWPAAISLALIVGTSHVIRFENSNVRFYGLLFALVALATLLAVKLGERERPGWGLLTANVAVQAALVLCHPLGGFYGAGLLTAVCAGDVLVWRRLRLPVALSYPAGWLALLFWARQLLNQTGINRPHSWVAVPEFRDIAGVLYGGSDFYPLFLLFVVLAAGRVLWRNAPAEIVVPAPKDEHVVGGSAPLFTDAQRRQWLIAGMFISIPLGFWVLSQAVPSNPLFLARYVIGVSIGWAVVLAQLVTFLLQRFGRRPNGWMKAVMAGFIVLNLGLLITEPGPDDGGLTGESDPAFGHAELPIVCLRSHDFLPREHYSPQADRYYFLLDWEVAAAPGNTRHATVEYKVLNALRRNYAGLFHHHIVDAQEFLRTHPVFLIHEVPHTSWVALRLKPEEYTITHLEPDRALDYMRDGVWPMLLVEKKKR